MVKLKHWGMVYYCIIPTSTTNPGLSCTHHLSKWRQCHSLALRILIGLVSHGGYDIAMVILGLLVSRSFSN